MKIMDPPLGVDLREGVTWSWNPRTEWEEWEEIICTKASKWMAEEKKIATLICPLVSHALFSIIINLEMLLLFPTFGIKRVRDMLGYHYKPIQLRIQAGA